MEQAAVILKKGEGRTLKAGGAWIFDNEIDKVEGTPEDGSLVEVRDFDGYGMGTGFYNSRSKIRVRMMSRKAGQPIDRDFLRMRVQNAWDYRKKTVDTSSCRIIFGEADFLPGLVVDKFSDVLVVQSLALGIDRMKEEILSLLVEVLRADGVEIRGIYERSDAKVREQEGLPRQKGFIGAAFAPPGYRSWKTVCAMRWMWRTVRKPASSWTRSTTVLPSSGCAGMPGYWTALPIPVPLPSMPVLPGLPACWVWTPPSWRWIRPASMPNSTGSLTG